MLLAVAMVWASFVGRSRPQPAELAAAEFVLARALGDCDVAAALVVGDRHPRCSEGPVIGQPRIGRTRTALRVGDDAVVLVELVGLSEQVGAARDADATWLPVGVAFDDDGGRWQVAREPVACLEPASWTAPARCDRWDWP